MDLNDIDDSCFGVWAEIPKQHISRFHEIVASAPEAQYHHNGSAFREGIVTLHITHKEANKGIATLRLLGLLGIKLEETMVIGDGGNDEPLFNMAGLHSRIAVQNESTPESLLCLADHVVGSVHEDGFAQAVQKHITKGG